MKSSTESKLGLCFLICGISVIGLFGVVSNVAEAQSFLDENNGINLVLNPQFPEPLEPVTLSLDDYSVETTGATIMWYVNGAEQRQFRNERAMTFTTPTLGKRSEVRVVLSRTNAPSLSHTRMITPTVADIILEANTYVPTFYKGRALPSGESTVRAIAVINDGSTLPDSAYTYKWSLDDSVFFGGPVKGKHIVSFIMPRYAGSILSVEVINTEGTTVAQKNIPLTIAVPEIHFYEFSPLRGLYTKEVPTPLTLIGDETTIYGEPYFMNTRMNANASDFTWKINGGNVSHDAGTPNAITLQKTGGAGSAQVEFTVVTKTQIPQFVEKYFNLVF